MRNTYEPYQQTTTTEHQVHDLGQVQTNAADLNVYVFHLFFSYCTLSTKFPYLYLSQFFRNFSFQCSTIWYLIWLSNCFNASPNVEYYEDEMSVWFSKFEKHGFFC